MLMNVIGVICYFLCEGQHPWQRERIEATGDIKDRMNGWKEREDFAVELVKDGEPLSRRGMMTHYLHAYLQKDLFFLCCAQLVEPGCILLTCIEIGTAYLMQAIFGGLN